jgi:hypothetical protein
MIGGVAAGLSHYLDSMYGLEQYLYFSTSWIRNRNTYLHNLMDYSRLKLPQKN